jgi:hypothetical protein
MRRSSNTWLGRALSAATLTVALATPATAQAGTPPCVGDCDGSGEVTVDEIITMVNIALGEEDLNACDAGDGNGDGEITVDEILQATTHALQGCGPADLGVRRFLLSPEESPFDAVVAPDMHLTLGLFRGQSDGQVEDAFIDLEAGEPDEDGIAVINVTEASDYFFAQSTLASLTICAKLLVPAIGAGFVDCDGGSDVSIGTVVNHRLGQIGVDGFTVQDCEQMGGTVESANQICAAGLTGDLCVTDEECETAAGAGDGTCGLQESTCTEGAVGAVCRADADCDSAPTTPDGICGTVGPHPAVCNGPVHFEPVGGDSGPGAVNIGPSEMSAVEGLPVELTLETAPPCGDEGAGTVTPFAFTTGVARTTILNSSNTAEDLVFDLEGSNLSCDTWRTGKGGRFVLGVPALHLNPLAGGDIVTAFTFGEASQ